jgi:hypothetical protein
MNEHEAQPNYNDSSTVKYSKHVLMPLYTTHFLHAVAYGRAWAPMVQLATDQLNHGRFYPLITPRKSITTQTSQEKKTARLQV